MKRNYSQIATSFTALAVLQFGNMCYAKDNIDNAAPITDVDSDPASDDNIASETRDSTGLTEIVVTATKRETNLQDTPISISVLGADDIKKRHVQSLIDLGDGSIPSLRVATFESRQSALTIGLRGIVPGDANQPAREQGVGVYVDGVYLGRQHGLNAGLLDVERIEVLKGPQGTLFGRNTEGGAVNVISRAPSGEFGGRITAGAGNFGSYNGALHVDLPAIAGISFKIDAGIQHQDATIKNPLAGAFGWNYANRYGGRVAARVQPLEGLTADLAFDIGRDENTPFYSQLINYNPLGRPVATLAQIIANGNRLPAGTIAPLPSIVQVQPERATVANVGVPQQLSIGKTKGFSSSIKWAVSDTLELRSITAWRTVNDDQFDNSGGANRTPVFLPNAGFSRYSLATLDQRQFSQEIQAVGSLPNLDYVYGLYYFNERANDSARTPNSNQYNADGTSFTIISPTTYASTPIARASIAFAKSYAAYGQVTYTPKGLDIFHLTLGGRYTKDNKNGSLFTVNGAATTFTFNQKNSRFDPLITLAVEATPDINFYAKYATGYRAGGASSRSLNYRSFGPESVKSYEIGAKTEFFNRLIRLNIAGYVTDRTNSQVDFNFFIPQSNGTVRNTLETVNAIGITKIRGIEADLTLNPAPGLSAGLSYAYTSIKIPPAQNTVQEQLNASLPVPITGSVFQNVFVVYTPKHALSGSLDYDLPVGSSSTVIKAHLDANYSSPAFTFDNENVKNEAAFIVNGRLSVADIVMSNAGQKLTVSLWARNLFNEQHIYRRSNANRQVLGDYANFNAPRTFGVEANLAF
jgi:iron complex outermembrane recepter protein